MALGFHDGVAQRIPDRGMSFQTAPRILETPFGDGYTQRLPDGINTIPKSFTINFKNRLKADIDDIVNYLEGTNGTTAFTFTYADDNGASGETDIKVIARSWTKNFHYDDYFSLTIQLEQIFEP